MEAHFCILHLSFNLNCLSNILSFLLVKRNTNIGVWRLILRRSSNPHWLLCPSVWLWARWAPIALRNPFIYNFLFFFLLFIFFCHLLFRDLRFFDIFSKNALFPRTERGDKLPDHQQATEASVGKPIVRYVYLDITNNHNQFLRIFKRNIVIFMSGRV